MRNRAPLHWPSESWSESGSSFFNLVRIHNNSSSALLPRSSEKKHTQPCLTIGRKYNMTHDKPSSAKIR